MLDFGLKCDSLGNILKMMLERIDPVHVAMGRRFRPENRVPGRLVREELCVGFHRLVHLVCNIDFGAMLDFMQYNENGHDCIVNTFKDLLHNFDHVISGYRFYTSNIEIYLVCQSAFYRLLSTLLKIAKKEVKPDSGKIREYGANLLHAVRRMADDVYRDEPVPPFEYALTDEPMTLPAPDAGEVDARLPSRREMMGVIKDWHLEEVDRSLARMSFMRLDKSQEQVFANECVQRLMGYSYRIWRDQTMTHYKCSGSIPQQEDAVQRRQPREESNTRISSRSSDEGRPDVRTERILRAWADALAIYAFGEKRVHRLDDISAAFTSIGNQATCRAIYRQS